MQVNRVEADVPHVGSDVSSAMQLSMCLPYYIRERSVNSQQL